MQADPAFQIVDAPPAGKPSFETLTPAPGTPRFPALDGWRGISILLVMSGHLLPMGPKQWSMNEDLSAFGMAIFFTLSGFLITTTLLYRPSVVEFLIRRVCRIVPLAWFFSLIALTLAHASWQVYLGQLLFYANLPPFWLTAYTGHLWSLCVEMQFYLSIALLCAIFGRRGLWSIPVFCILVTAYRAETHTLASIVTTLRVDEILSGGTLALICNTPHLPWAKRFLFRVSPLVLIPLGLASANHIFGGLDYLRPYFTSSMVGSTLLYARKPFLARWLEAKWLGYIAAVSYALYIFHPMVAWGWLGSGTKIVMYLKRVPELAAVFGLAHVSTFYFEDYWIRFGKKWSKRLSTLRPIAPPAGDSRGVLPRKMQP